MSELRRLLAGLPDHDLTARAEVEARSGRVLRPTGALDRLDRIAVWLAGWQRCHRPAVRHPHAILFAGDHGVAADGVSAYPSDITAAMVAAIRAGVATSTAMAAALGMALDVHDVGVGRPTGNIRTDDAMSADEFDDVVGVGAASVDGLEGPVDLLVFGEMGIGNTTPASAIANALFGGSAARWTGPGTGVADETLHRKIGIVAEAVARVDEADPLEILRRLGGWELAAIAGAVTAARHRSIPVVLDGFITTAAVAPLECAAPGALDHCVSGHASPEPGHRHLVDRLGLEPILDLDMRLGEGSGALAAVPLIKLAAAAVTDVATFDEWGIE